MRRAGPEDSEAVAELIYATSPKLHDRFVGGKAQSLVMLTTAFASPGNNVSAEVRARRRAERRGGGRDGLLPGRRGAPARARGVAGGARLHAPPSLAGGAQHLPARWALTASPPTRSLYVDSIATDERMRRRGVARALLARADELARSQGLLRVALDTDVENTPARHLYESSGFIGVAETRPRGGLPGFVSYVKTL